MSGAPTNLTLFHSQQQQQQQQQTTGGAAQITTGQDQDQAQNQNQATDHFHNIQNQTDNTTSKQNRRHILNMQTHKCKSCGEFKVPSGFSKTQWERSGGKGKCKTCVDPPLNTELLERLDRSSMLAAAPMYEPEKGDLDFDAMYEAKDVRFLEILKEVRARINIFLHVIPLIIHSQLCPRPRSSDPQPSDPKRHLIDLQNGLLTVLGWRYCWNFAKKKTPTTGKPSFVN